jgi:hypothetical protein
VSGGGTSVRRRPDQYIHTKGVDNGNGAITHPESGLVLLKRNVMSRGEAKEFFHPTPLQAHVSLVNRFGVDIRSQAAAEKIVAKLASDHKNCQLKDGSRPGDWRLMTVPEFRMLGYDYAIRIKYMPVILRGVRYSESRTWEYHEVSPLYSDTQAVVMVARHPLDNRFVNHQDGTVTDKTLYHTQ